MPTLCSERWSYGSLPTYVLYCNLYLALLAGYLMAVQDRPDDTQGADKKCHAALLWPLQLLEKCWAAAITFTATEKYFEVLEGKSSTEVPCLIGHV